MNTVCVSKNLAWLGPGLPSWDTVSNAAILGDLTLHPEEPGNSVKALSDFFNPGSAHVCIRCVYVCLENTAPKLGTLGNGPAS